MGSRRQARQCQTRQFVARLDSKPKSVDAGTAIITEIVQFKKYDAVTDAGSGTPKHQQSPGTNIQ
jgi:hypothetical protein